MRQSSRWPLNSYQASIFIYFLSGSVSQITGDVSQFWSVFMQSFQRHPLSVVGECGEPPAATWIQQGEGKDQVQRVFVVRWGLFALLLWSVWESSVQAFFAN